MTENGSHTLESGPRMSLAAAVALLCHYCDVIEVDAWSTVLTLAGRYSPDWVRLAVIEAIYQGRYKLVSVEYILQLWQRRGKPICHFNREFEAIVAVSLSPELQSQLNQVQLDPILAPSFDRELAVASHDPPDVFEVEVSGVDPKQTDLASLTVNSQEHATDASMHDAAIPTFSELKSHAHKHNNGRSENDVAQDLKISPGATAEQATEQTVEHHSPTSAAQSALSNSGIDPTSSPQANYLTSSHSSGNSSKYILDSISHLTQPIGSAQKRWEDTQLPLDQDASSGIGQFQPAYDPSGFDRKLMAVAQQAQYP